MVRQFTFPTSVDAWVGMNQYMVKYADSLKNDPNVKLYRHQIIIYDVMMRIKRSYIPDDWDFTKTVNYRQAKWTSLVSNYINLNHLEEVLAAVKHREIKKTANYNETAHFGNAHTHGKGCLLVCTFSRRYSDEVPVLNAVMRASEFYKRGMMDLLLLHRMGELAYGDEPFAINIFAQQLWGGADWLSLLYAVEPQFILDLRDDEGFKGEVYSWYRKFKIQRDIDGLSYHAHKRACKVIQGITATPALLAEDCYIY